MQDLKLECLLSSAREVLLKLVESDYMKNFVLVGGSALARTFTKGNWGVF